MPSCETCNHWDHSPNPFTGKPTLWGRCLCESITNGDSPSRSDAATFWAGDQDGEAHLLTGPAFGCVHHQPR
jgi:hypothetical protein